VTVLILAPARDAAAGPLLRVLDAARAMLADRQRAAFLELGAAAVRIVREPPDYEPFGRRLRRLVQDLETTGVIVLGAGSIPLATDADLAAFIEAAAGPTPGALANSYHSADAVAVSCAAVALRDLPDDLATDNALPRWLAEVGGVPVSDLRRRRDLAVDVDCPLDLLLLESAIRGVPVPSAADAALARDRLARVRAVVADPASELLVAGRVGAVDLARIEGGTAARTRALVEERGLRTASLAMARGIPNRRPPRSVLADLVGEDPGSLARVVARYADAAIIDTRVLLAARHGADERAWPEPEDRFASDLLLVNGIRDPWPRSLTESAATATIPILLGGHTLVGPGAPLALGLDA
jgi:CTP:molybdopterin cytidylyltransferase MocA